jgi:hypothetical protein
MVFSSDEIFAISDRFVSVNFNKQKAVAYRLSILAKVPSRKTKGFAFHAATSPRRSSIMYCPLHKTDNIDKIVTH